MKSLMKKQAERFLRERKRYRRWLAMFLCLAIVVTSGTFTALMQSGHAMEYTDSDAEDTDVDVEESSTEVEEEPEAQTYDEPEDVEAPAEEAEPIDSEEGSEETETNINTDTNTDDTIIKETAEPSETVETDGSTNSEDNSEETDPNPVDTANPEDMTTPEEPTDAEQDAEEVKPDQTANPDDQVAPEEGTDPSTQDPVNPEENILPEESTDNVEEVIEEQGTDDETDEVEEEDFSGLMTPEELEALSEDEVGSTMWQDSGISMFRMRRQSNWSFDAYYVNKDDSYDVTETSDFNLKYQMEFHANSNFETGDIEIRIPRTLLRYRGEGEFISSPVGACIVPTDIAVPEGGPEEEDYVSNRNTPFNYYIDDNGTPEEDDDELVFFNYKPINTGTNVAWQVLYKNLPIMEIIDLEEWSLQPRIMVKSEDADEEDEWIETTPLTGRVDSSVNLDSMTKEAYVDSQRLYTPGLYTESQVKQYINGDLPEKYSGENFADYKYVVWDVKVRGSANQPWNLVVNEWTGFMSSSVGYVQGEVVGVRDNSNAATVYNMPLELGELTGNWQREGVTVKSNCKEKSWGSRFYVVTAYPADLLDEGRNIVNDITVIMKPVDFQGEYNVKKSSANWSYMDYHWTYTGDMVGVKKKSDKVDYIGWLDVYQEASRQKEDYGDFPFYTEGVFKGYGYTRKITENGDGSVTVGDYEEGNAYKLTTMDDFMYIDNQMLTGEDYYFTGVTITQKDVGYDIFEDKETKPCVNIGMAGSIDRDVDIYAMYAGSNEWELVDTIPWDDSGVMTYTFSSEQLDRQPWRVKVEHPSVEYKTTCQLDVKVRFRWDSPVLNELLKENPDAKTATILDVSGVIGEEWKNNNWEQIVPEQKGDNYNPTKWPELAEKSKDLYGLLPQRDSAGKEVKKLGEEAASFKTSNITNDVNNNRVLVDYCLTAYDGYEIFSQEAVNYLKSVEEHEGLKTSPGRNQVAFYDLLPEGMTFDPSQPVTAGRITNLDKKGNYKIQPKSWDTSQVTVTVDSEEDIISNWRGTGRTMVIFHITYSGADSAVFTNNHWIEGWGVSFRAYYDWKDSSAINQRYNISAFMPDEQDEADRMYHKPLRGTEDQVACDDGKIVPEGLENECKAFGSDINGDKITDIRNVLYAEEVISDDFSQSALNGIQKLVRADADRFGIYSESATVGTNGYYTYDITVAAASKTGDLIVYDRLENAIIDRNGKNDPFSPFSNANWKGTFQSINVKALEDRGIVPVIWYNTSQNAAIPEGLPDEDWWKDNGWTQEPESSEAVLAIAVDMRTKTDGTSFVLNAGESVSFQIQMKAPDGKGLDLTKENYTYNSSSYYCKLMNESGEGSSGALLSSDSVRVGLEETEDLEIIKKFDENGAPDSVKDTSFEFKLYENIVKGDKESEVKPFANKEYLLYKLVNGNWESQTDRLYATDSGGYLKLHADEKAVFKDLAGAEHVQVEETANVFWEPTLTQEKREEEGHKIYSVTVTNTYRPVLYVQKMISGVPEGVDTTKETFTFELKVNGEPLKNAKYCYVDSVRMDGGSPNVKTELGNKGYGTTDENGRFQIHKDEIIALFPGEEGAQYELTEVEGAGEDDNWICKTPTVNGTIYVRGSRAYITNYYRWKDLHLTKELTHQDPEECVTSFTFRIEEVTGDTTKPVAGNSWKLLNADGTPIEAGTLNVNGTPIATTGKLDSNGQFECFCAGRTVQITGLEAEKTYVVTEIMPDSTSGETVLYQPVTDSQEVKMPLFSGKKEMTFINDYLMRPLSITKTLVRDQNDSGGDDPSFTMEVQVNGKPLKNHPYTLMENGNVVQPEEGKSHSTGENGRFSIKGGQTAVFEDAGLLGSEFAVYEVQDERYPQIYPANPDAAEETVRAGELGVPYKDTFTGDKSQATIVNGSGGYLMISKEYVAGDEEGAEFVEYLKTEDTWKADNWSDIWDENDPDYNWKLVNPNNLLYGRFSEGAVELTLYIADEDGFKTIWPQPMSDEDDILPGLKVTVINQLTNESREAFWGWGGSICLDPWKTVLIPTNKIPEGATYILQESENDQHKVVYWKRNNSGLPSIGNMTNKRVQINQKEPANDQAITGKVGENPVATIVNEAKGINITSRIEKWMTPDSNEVPVGAKLVWRVEQYDGNTKTWKPASGISYMIENDNDWENPSSNIWQTGEDGKIVLTQSPSGDCPVVDFIDTKVYLNLYDNRDGLLEDGVLRLVEVLEESDEAWGMLAGYGTYSRLPDEAEERSLDTSKAVGFAAARLAIGGGIGGSTGAGSGTNIGGGIGTGSNSGTTNSDSYSFDVSSEDAIAFVNSNKTIPVEIGKEMETNSDERFTMLLKQVISAKDSITKPEDIVVSEARQGIKYIIYDTTTEEMIKEEMTGPNGEIELRAGQYAKLYLPKETLWTVSESLKPNYELKDLRGEPEEDARLTKLDNNLMLIDLSKAARPTYTVTYNYQNEVIAQKSYTEGETVFVTDQSSDRFNPNGKLLGWSTSLGGPVEYELGSRLKIGSEDVTLYAVCEENTCRLLYMDKSEVYRIELYEFGETAILKGCTTYEFVGWSSTRGSSEAEYKEGDPFKMLRDETLFSVYKNLSLLE